jgi:hypothetical protein
MDRSRAGVNTLLYTFRLTCGRALQLDFHVTKHNVGLYEQIRLTILQYRRLVDMISHDRLLIIGRNDMAESSGGNDFCRKIRREYEGNSRKLR